MLQNYREKPSYGTGVKIFNENVIFFNQPAFNQSIIILKLV
jgi:hypothetical protein